MSTNARAGIRDFYVARACRILKIEQWEPKTVRLKFYLIFGIFWKKVKDAHGTVEWDLNKIIKHFFFTC